MENFSDLLITRHSIRKYTDEPLSGDAVKLILQAGLLAPTSKNSRAWEFVVIEDKTMLGKLAEMKDFGAASVPGCAMAIAVCIDAERTDAWIEDGSVAATLMQLQAEALGLGSCWVQVRDRMGGDGFSSEEYVKDNLNIPAGLRVLCLVTIGHKNEVRRPANLEKLLWERVHIGTFKKPEE